MQALIASGHRWPGLMDYTARQLRLFHAEAVRAADRARADQIEDINLGLNGGDVAADALAKLRRL